MVWEFKLPTIVMLTKEIEKGVAKRARYWPQQVNLKQDFGEGMRVKLLERECFQGYNCERFSLENTIEEDSSPFQVTHYHFTEWPDHGVPDDKMCMLTLIGSICQKHPPEGPPLVVHCSAGVGRTGTFIVLDTMLQRMKHLDTLNIYDFLLHIRQQRTHLVQSESQYIYIHESLAEYIQCGDTSFPINDVHQVLQELCENAKLKRQFDLLQEVSDHLFVSYTDAQENLQKNRYNYSLPFNHSRVVLSAVDDEDNYINASWIDGYQKRCCFIAARSPLENTVGHFWRMLVEQQSSTIVMLCKLVENHQIQCHLYWPQSETEKENFGNVTVTLETEIQEQDYVVRCFEAKMENPFRSLSVTQFHFLDWPEDDKPRDNFSLLKMLKDVIKNQSDTGNRPITVICNDGIGRTGTFMTVYSQIERAKSEGIVDVFQFIRGARMQRFGLVRIEEQYLFCHDVLSDYREEMSKYENFKHVI